MKNKIAFSVKCVIAKRIVFVFCIPKSKNANIFIKTRKGQAGLAPAFKGCLTSLRKGIAVVSNNDGCKQIKWRMII